MDMAKADMMTLEVSSSERPSNTTKGTNSPLKISISNTLRAMASNNQP